MATRRCLKTLISYCNSILSFNTSTPRTLNSLTPHLRRALTQLHPYPHQSQVHFFTSLVPSPDSHFAATGRHFCTSQDSDDDDGDSEAGSGDDESVSGSVGDCVKDKAKEVAAIGYEVIGPLQDSESVFQPYEPVYAVVQVGSHQFKVSNGDSIYTERLKSCNVNDKLILNKVLMLGSRTQTIIGRPTLPDAKVHAVVEEHAFDAKVIIFKKKRRKNYRRTKGHRQELTKLRITDIQGIEKPENTKSGNKENTVIEKVDKVAVAA